MKITDIKLELEKVSRLVPELREKLDEAYHLAHGKKSRIKLIWREFSDRYEKVKNSKEYRDLH